MYAKLCNFGMEMWNEDYCEDEVRGKKNICFFSGGDEGKRGGGIVKNSGRYQTKGVKWLCYVNK